MFFVGLKVITESEKGFWRVGHVVTIVSQISWKRLKFISRYTPRRIFDCFVVVTGSIEGATNEYKV